MARLLFPALLLATLLSPPPVVAAEMDDLLEVYRQAVNNDPQIRRARAQRDEVLERRPQARSLLLPSIGLFADYQYSDREYHTYTGATDPSGDTTSIVYGVRLTQPLFDATAFALNRQAGAEIARAEAEYTAAQQQLIVRSAEVYFSLLSALDGLEFARAEMRSIERQLQQARQRFEVGVIAITGVQEAQAAYDLAVAREIAAQQEVISAQEALRELTGIYSETLRPLGEEIPLATPEPANVEAWVESALEQNLQLQAARLARDSARAGVSRTRAERLPKVELSAGLQRVDAEQLSPIPGESEYDEAVVGVQMTMPLFTGGLLNSQVREARYREEQARQISEQQLRAVERLTRDAFLGLQSSASQVKALRQAVRSNRTALGSVEAGLDAGTRTNVEVLDARRELFRAQRDYANSRYQYVLNTLRLRQAAGTLGPADLADINEWLEQDHGPDA